MGIPIPSRSPTVPHDQSVHPNTPCTSLSSLKVVKNRKMEEVEKNEGKRSFGSGMRTMIIKSGCEGCAATCVKRIKNRLPRAHKRSSRTVATPVPVSSTSSTHASLSVDSRRCSRYSRRDLGTEAPTRHTLFRSCALLHRRGMSLCHSPQRSLGLLERKTRAPLRTDSPRVRSRVGLASRLAGRS